MFLNLSELSNHLFVDFEILFAILPWVAKWFPAHTAEGEQSCHAERRIDKYAQVTTELFGIHGTHGGGNDEVGLEFGNLLLKEGHGFSRHNGDIWGKDLHALLVEGITKACGGAAGATTGKAVEI